MTIKVNYLDQGKGMEFLLSGIVNGSDIINVHKEVHTPEVIAALRYKIIDKRKVTENYISHEEVKIISELDRKVKSINSNIITAYISPNDLIKSLGELWKTLTDDESNNIKTFNTREDADKWIAIELNKT